MPGANKYAVKVGNRFALSNSAESGSDSGSEDELQNVDPFAMIKKAEVDAVRKVKQDLKNAEEAKRQAKIAAATGAVDQEQPAQPARQNRREPRANNAPRRGPRNERVEKNDDNRQANNQDGTRPPRRTGDGERRRGGPRREKDRQSGDPRTAVKGREKRGGGGSYNWGKPGDEQWEQEEKPTPETEGETEKPEKENVDQENENPQPEEPKEPETMTLEEYLKQSATISEPIAQGPGRKANDGQDIKGNRLAKKEVYREPTLRQYNKQEQVNKKNVVPTDKLNFSKYRPARFNNRDNDRNNNRRDNRDNNKNQKFNIQDQDFPTLGAKN